MLSNGLDERSARPAPRALMRNVVRLATPVALAASLLWAPHATADCSDTTPRLLWSHPADGATGVTRVEPVLLRTSAPIDSASINGMPATISRAHSPGDLWLLVPPAALVLSQGQADVELQLAGGDVATLGFTLDLMAPAQTAPPAQIVIDGHFVDGLPERLTGACSDMLFDSARNACWSWPATRLIGFDARVTPEGQPDAASPAPVIAWVVEGVMGGGELSGPQLWPVDCGMPALFTTLEVDDGDHCAKLLAYLADRAQPIESDTYCLGGGVPWPAPPEPDPSTMGAGVVDAGALLPPPDPFPVDGDCSGPCGCVRACDLIDPLAGTGVTAGAAPAGGSGGTGVLGGGGAAATTGSATVAGTEDATGSGGGCSIGPAGSARASTTAWLLIATFAILTHRRRVRRS